MKRQYIYTFVLFFSTFLLTLVLTGCEKLKMEDDDCGVLLHDAATAIHEMNFSEAEPRLQKVLEHSSNHMHRLSADLMMMRIYMLTADSKQFYDYRADAEKCMLVLKEDEEYMEGRQLKLWHFSQESFYMLSQVYFTMARQKKKVHEMLDMVGKHPEWSDGEELGFRERLLPEQYMITLQIVHDADQLCINGYYDDALALLSNALHRINTHHVKYNKGVTPDDTLAMYGLVGNDVSKEMQWISDPNIIAIPDWMACVREELSIVYGAMGNKEASNYNRNIYFDILDATRQDMQVEQRKEMLQEKSKFLNLLIVLLLAFAIVMSVGIYVFSKKISRTSKDKNLKLKKCLEVCESMARGENVDEEVHGLLPFVKGDWRKADLKGANIKSYEHEILSLLQVFDAWIAQNTEMYESQFEQQEQLEGEIYMEQRRMEENKRRHTDRATAISIVQGITPFLDRAIHQVERGNDYFDKSLFSQFVEKINSYNDVLGHWVKVKQGSVVLNVENFSLAPLLETLQKGHRAFESKNIALAISVEDVVVKADRALTLFMMNTLLDNARKYTPEGGRVSLNLNSTDTYVEISVEDTGRGLSEEDQDKINNMKVYDSSQIGLENDSDGSIKQNKGFGFGLMNCRGIIEKYRKSGKMFDVCQFGVDSTLGSGSRFFFRLPKGVIRTLSSVLFLLLPFMVSAQTAEVYLDSMIEANLRSEYDRAVEFADSAISAINVDYMLLTGQTEPHMALYSDDGDYAEMQWMEDSVEMDYGLIIQVRNEVCLAALSLPDKDLYRYNNEAFIQLNKSITNDLELENICKRLASANADKNLIIALSLIILLLSMSTYALLYYRHTILPVFNMRQLVEFLKRLFSAKEEELSPLFFQAIDSFHPANIVGAKLNNGKNSVVGEGVADTEIPLTLDFEGERHDMGTMYIGYRGSKPTLEDNIIIGFFAQFASIHTFFSSVKVEQQNGQIELLEEQKFAAETEQQRLHVQNMVLDNCLSTIKHETMYYPNRILQLLNSEEDNIDEIRDVLKYYREVFSLLSENASRQLSRSIVKLQKVGLDEVASYAKKSFARQNKKQLLPLQFSVSGCTDGSVRADVHLLQYLLDTIISLAFEDKTEGNIELNFEKSAGFIKFALSDSRTTRTEEENSLLFYADSLRYDAQKDMLLGAQFLIAKQIIRDHDDRLGHQGCRIFAQEKSIVFTLPMC